MAFQPGRRLGGSQYVRAAIAKGAFASKVYHTFKAQAPFESMRTLALQRIQDTLNKLVFGGFNNVATTQAQQAKCDGGFGHVNLHARVHAEYAHLVRELIVDTPSDWKNIWWHRLRKVYGPLASADLPLTLCTFERLTFDAAPSQVQQAAFQTWGKIKKTLIWLGNPPTTPAGIIRRQNRAELAAYDGEPPPKITPIWQSGPHKITGAHVGHQRLFFHPAWGEKSNYFTEGVAIDWARAGLSRIKDVQSGTRLMGQIG